MRPEQQTKAAILFFISLALIVAGDIGAYFVQTSGRNVEVTGFTLSTTNGLWVTADLFKPKSATETNLVPMVVVCPGFERSKETMTSYSIELARRGIAVVTIDPYNQGASSSTMQKRSASTEGYGVIPMVEYIYDTTNLNFVDKLRIGAVGYSAGGNAVLQSAARFGARKAKALRQAERKDSDGGKTITDAEAADANAQNKISAIFIGGYVLTLSNAVLANVDANVGLDYARYDEGAFRTQNGSADMRTAPEAIRLVNSALSDSEGVSEVEIGKIYGSLTNHTLRVVHNTKSIHPLMPYNTTHIANVIDYFTRVFGLSQTIPSSNQIWLLKEFFTLMALIGGLLFLVPCAALLMRLPVFSSLAQPIPPALPTPGRNGKIVFWLTFAVSAALACFLFIPMARATATIFPQATTGTQTWFFPQRINNAILLWAVANGVIGLFLFTLNYQLMGKKNGVMPTMWGLKTSLNELAKTCAVALIVFAGFYALLFASYGIFHADFRFLFISAPAAFPQKMWLVALEYLPPFFIFYLANSIRVNGAAWFAGQREWVGLLISALGNSVGLMMILAIQYVHLASTGAVFWTQEWLYTNLLLGVTPMMFVLPIFNRIFFRMTGKVYLGALITCLVFILMMLTSNVCYIPLK